MSLSQSSTFVETGFGPVADAFLSTISDDTSTGAALSIWMDGTPVVEMSAGTANRNTGQPFGPDTLATVYSCTKGLATIVVGRLIQDGRLPSLDTPITSVWPEFGAHGKGAATIGDALAHRAGVPAPRADIDPAAGLDELAVADLLAAQVPLWEVPKHHNYHAITHGSITGKLVRNATGQTLGTVFRREIAVPLAADTWIGLPEEEDERVAWIVDETTQPAPDSALDPETLYWAERIGGFLGPLPLRSSTDVDPFHRYELSGVSGTSTASGLARIYSSTVVETNGVRLLEPQTVDDLRASRSSGAPYFVTGPAPYQSFGAGFMIPSDWDPYLSASSFGHDGAGGQVAFADIDAKLGFAYVTNEWGDWQRGIAVTRALAHVLG
jgi:CubicO group peptidase (beta-lactamase class C family)